MSDQQQQIAQGSLRSSHRNTHAIILKKANNDHQQKAIEFLNSSNLDLVIQQKLSSDKAEIPLKRGTFFVQTYTSKMEPGFLVFLPNSPPIFLKYNLSKKERNYTNGQPLAYILRLRTSAKVNEGSIFVASIDTINHKLYFEDIYMWANDNLFAKKTFLERRKVMEEFVSKHWIPDVRLLGGLISEIIQPMPLASFESLLDKKDFMKVSFIPNSFGKRRFTILLNEAEARIGESQYYGRKEDKTIHTSNTSVSNNVSNTVSNTVSVTVAKAVRVPMLPDVYELYDITNTSLSRACVQDLQLSKKLKELKSNDIFVKIKYNDDFKRYEITDLHSP